MKLKNAENKAVVSEVESTFLWLSAGETLQQKFGSVQDESAVGRRDGAEEPRGPESEQARNKTVLLSWCRFILSFACIR